MHHLRYNIASALGAILFVAFGLAALREADNANELWDSWLFSLTLGLLLFAVLLAAHRTGDRRAFWIGFALFGWGYLSLSLIPSTEPRLISRKALAYLRQSNIFFVRAYRMRAILALDRMRAHNVSSHDLMKALTPSGMVSGRSAPYDDLMTVVEDKRVSPAQLGQATGQASQPVEYVLSWGTRYNKPEQYGNIIVKALPDGEILRLKDVAKVEMGSSFYAPRAPETAENFMHIGHSLFALLVALLGGVLSRRLRSVSVTTSPLDRRANHCRASLIQCSWPRLTL
jgi:hypothetical protein